jgi:hypothetical protein
MQESDFTNDVTKFWPLHHFLTGLANTYNLLGTPVCSLTCLLYKKLQ